MEHWSNWVLDLNPYYQTWWAYIWVCLRYPFPSTGLSSFSIIFQYFPLFIRHFWGTLTFNQTNIPHFHYSLLNHHNFQVQSPPGLWVNYMDTPYLSIFHGFQWISPVSPVLSLRRNGRIPGMGRRFFDVPQELLGRFYGRLLALKGDAGSLEEIGVGKACSSWW